MRYAVQVAVVQGVRDLIIGRDPDLSGVADVRQSREEKPADKAEVHDKQLSLMTLHHAGAFTDAFKHRHFGMLDDKVQRHSVAVARYDAGNDKQQRPQENEDACEYPVQDQPQDKRKAAQNVGKRGGAVRRVQRKDRETDAQYTRYEHERKSEQHRNGVGQKARVAVDELLYVCFDGGVAVNFVYKLVVACGVAAADNVLHRALDLARIAVNGDVKRQDRS